MLAITNVSITERAAVALDLQKVLTRVEPDDVFALAYIVSFTEAGGATVEGFVPGYSLTVMKRHGLGESCALVHLPNGVELYVLTRLRSGYELRPDGAYVIDLIEPRYGTFSIAPVTAG
jgi:hypothetical protein